jgi:Skp family chaperone for outer membrane proteins
MKYYQIIKKKRLFLVVLLVLVAVVYGGYSLFSTYFGVKKTDFAAFDLNVLLREHPNWGRYQELQRELERIRGNWENPPPRLDESIWSTPGQYKLAPVERQMIELQNSYRLEETDKWGSIQKLLQDYHKRRMKELEDRLKARFEVLKKAFNTELEAKHDAQQKLLDAYRKKLEDEQYPALTNLQLRLATLGVNPTNTDNEERLRIQKEINNIKAEIDNKLEERAGQYEREFNAYQKVRSQQLNDQFTVFETKTNDEFKADFKRYQDKLDAEFRAWRTRRQQELNKSLEKRRQEQAQQQLLFSQQTQVYDGMMRDIRKAVREYAERNKIGCVVAGQLTSGQPDLTRQLAKMLK